FLIAKTFAPHLIQTAKTDTTLFSTISRMDGAFGFKAIKLSNPEHGALSGLVKTAGIEWEDVLCHSIDVSCDLKPDNKIVKNIVSEILNSDPASPIEIGISSDSRAVLKLEPSPSQTGEINLDNEDVIIVTGGARGLLKSLNG
ncbi:MAG: hypothetical protein JRJ39_08970, partial [Deltaproteobacteria bacterium]|nr:hypothetical protein [Deltaproteobacteria bacterium]